MTDYTQTCPCCEVGDVHATDIDGDNYECDYCRSSYCVSSDRSDYVVLQDNSDGIAFVDKGLYSGRNYRRARYV